MTTKKALHRRLHLALSALLGLAMGLAAQAREAKACSPPAGGIYQREVQPKDKESDVPTNAQVIVTFGYGSFGRGFTFPEKESITLRDAKDQVVATSLQKYVTGSGTSVRAVWVLKPNAALAANASYSVVSRLKAVPCGGQQGVDCDASGSEVIAQFTTGAKRDDKAPVFAGAKDLACGESQVCSGGGCCGPYTRTPFSMGWDAATDDTPSGLRYNVYSKSDLTKPLLPLITAKAARGYVRHSGHEHFPSWDLLEGSPVTGFIVRAVDMAGNEDQNTKVAKLAQSCQPPKSEKSDENPQENSSPDGGNVGDPPESGPEKPANPEKSASLEKPASPEKPAENPKVGCHAQRGANGLGYLGGLLFLLCLIARLKRLPTPR